MTLPVETEPEHAAALHDALAKLAADLNTTALSETYGLVPGVRLGLSEIMRAARGLSSAVLPGPVQELPSDADLGWVEPHSHANVCNVLFGVDLESARRLTVLLVEHSLRLNHLLGRIQLQMPDRKAPRELVLHFAYVLGYIYTEICQPLHRSYPELGPLTQGPRE